MAGAISGALHQEPHSRGGAWSVIASSHSGKRRQPSNRPWQNGEAFNYLRTEVYARFFQMAPAGMPKGCGELNSLKKVYSLSTIHHPRRLEDLGNQVNPEFIAVVCCRLLNIAQHPAAPSQDRITSSSRLRACTSSQTGWLATPGG